MANKEVYDVITKVEKFKEGTLDLTTDEDLSIGLMNLVSIEEHLYFTYIKTDDDKYLDLLDLVRRTRIKFMKKVVKDPQGEEWCISKHLLSSSMRLLEVGNKLMSKGEKDEAKEFYESSFDMYSLFFGINMKDDKNFDTKTKQSLKTNKKAEIHKTGFLSKISSYVKEKIDCCKEL